MGGVSDAPFLGTHMLDGLRSLNAADVSLLAWLTYTALEGMRRGLVVSALRLVALGASLAVASTQYSLLVGPITATGLWVLSGPFAEVVAFLAALIVARVVAAIIVAAVTWVWKGSGGKLPVLGFADTMLGAVPGLLRGAIIGAIAVLPLRELSILPSVSDTVGASVVAQAILQLLVGLLPAVRVLAGM